ncbi:hypothetical protein ACHQM5_018271 [Ranunculus cassubicifolius]
MVFRRLFVSYSWFCVLLLEIITVCMLKIYLIKKISSKLRISQWNVAANSCRTGQGLDKFYDERNATVSNVICNCSFNNSTVCHVTNIRLKNLNLTGDLPVEFANLTYLREISLGGNFASGSIPREFGRISTLERLSLGDNNLVGPLPPELGNLRRLRTM